MPKGKKSRGGPSSQVSKVDHRVFHSAIARTPGGSGEVVTRVLTKEATIASSGGGTITSIGTFDASTFGDFATLAPLWDEWRPIGMKVTVQCAQAFAQPNAVVSRIAVIVFDNDDASTALTSYANAMDYRVKRVFGSIWGNDRLVTMSAEVLSVGDQSAGSLWQTTGTTAVAKSFKYFSSGLTATQTYFDVVYEYVVQFRQPT